MAPASNYADLESNTLVNASIASKGLSGAVENASRVFSDFADIPCRNYGAIYADPPWYFKVWGAKGTGRGAFSHYDLMSAEALRALPVGDLAAKDCMLFLWVPIPLREQGMDLIKAWGFRFATVGFTWIKPCKGPPSAPVAAKWGGVSGLSHRHRLTIPRQPRRVHPSRPGQAPHPAPRHPAIDCRAAARAFPQARRGA